jgi:isopenicillin N synthase-like dioxygenase
MHKPNEEITLLCGERHNVDMDFPLIDYRAADAPQRLCLSLRETGFAALRHTPLQAVAIRSIGREWLGFFRSPARQACLWDPVRQDGWFPPEVSEVAKGHSQRDLKEFFHGYAWGRWPDGVSDAARRYADQATGLAATLLAWVQAGSPENVRAGYSEPLPRMIEGSDRTLLRVLHYPPQVEPAPPGALRAAAHEDINLLTILPAAEEAGLQVQDRQGHWLDLPVTRPEDEDQLVIVNTGDMLQEASGGWFPSTPHRVLNPVGEAALRPRIALPLFLHPRAEVRLSARHTAGSCLDERLRELGLKT